ncbi:MAG: hypothetical protein H6983_16075 [Ectothiorhodospiraceae bacterium]|nr:hypothetical protein [Chromatiales bacterium]MCP5155686.1 hypothetical protein [Ectothiorhodospiraceae bacterium]
MRFCLLTTGRAGSTALMDAIAAGDDVTVPGDLIDCRDHELVNPEHLERHRVALERVVGHAVDGPAAMIDAFLEATRDRPIAGFKSMPNRHDDLQALVERPGLRIVTLRRRDLASTVASFMRAQATGQWRREGGRPPTDWRFGDADIPAVRANVAYVVQAQATLSRIPGAIHVEYEALCAPDFACPALDALFGRHIALDDPRPPTSARDYVGNWEPFRRLVEATARQVRRRLGIVAARATDP